MTQASVRISSEESASLTSRRGLLKGLGAFWAAAGLGYIFYGVYRFLAPGGEPFPPWRFLSLKSPQGDPIPFRLEACRES